MNSMPFLEATINGKRIAELISGDPWIDTEAAYQLLKLSNMFIRGPLRNLDYYQMVETALKRRYLAYITGIAPESQHDEEIAGISVLSALMFFRELGQEAKNITEAIDTISQSIAAKGEIDTKENESILILLEQVKEGNEVARIAVDLLGSAYNQRETS